MDEAPHDDEPCRARGCDESAPVCRKTPTYEVRAGGYRTFLCRDHKTIERAEAKEQGGHSKARCRQHAYDAESFPGFPEPRCNYVHAARNARPVWGWEVMG